MMGRLWFMALAVLLFGSAPTTAQAKDCRHTVASGDTLSGIAQRYGVSERALLNANPRLAQNPNLLRIGQELDVCVASSSPPARRERAKTRRCGRGGRIVEHEVTSGDTLSGIASAYGVTEAVVQRENPALKEHPDRLRAGQTLEICVEGGSARNSPVCNNETPLHHHEVVPGEHLGQIAGRYGVRRRDLVRLNAALRSNPDFLRVGQKLRVCPLIAPRERTQISYAVQSGDTIGGIAKQYGLTPGELVRYQEGRLADPNALREGQKLVVWVDGDVLSPFARRNDDRGVLRGGVQLPPGRHYVVKWAAAAWGTSKTIRTIQSAIASYKRKMPGGPKVFVGDISKRGGGKFPPHISHQHGRDVDVAYVHRGKYAHESRFHSVNRENLDVARSWALIKAFIDTDEVQYVFVDYRVQKMLYEYAREHGYSEEALDELFQYPRGRGRSHGLIRHWKGHVNHFHVRFAK